MTHREFDNYSASYEDLLSDPIRERFAGASSEFFHIRKSDLIRDYFRNRQIDSHCLRYLDIGCGKGELISLLREDFGYVAGCDPSQGMLTFVHGIDTRVQEHTTIVPFETASFDFISAVCVYHHVPSRARLGLTRDVFRVLRPAGVFAIIEHNPNNPVTRLIVSRTPVDAGAALLKSREARHWMLQAGFSLDVTKYFLFFPRVLYKHGGRNLEGLLGRLPLGGQYVVFGRKPVLTS